MFLLALLLTVLPIQHNASTVPVSALQGGPTQSHVFSTTIALQGLPVLVQANPADGENIQPAAGYNSLSWKLQ